MLVIFASPYDPTAAALAARWVAHDAAVLSCQDLSIAGWRYYPGVPGSSTAVIGGRVVEVERIDGVLVRWPGVYAEELSGITPEDRGYVAAEMNAFLIAWLSELKCPVLNRPTATSLRGPGWRKEQWAWAAAQAGIPVHPVERQVRRVGEVRRNPPVQQSCTVTVVGEQCFGAAHPELAVQARRLAQASGVQLLGVRFSGPEAGAAFIHADLTPDLADEAVANAVLACLLKPGGQ